MNKTTIELQDYEAELIIKCLEYTGVRGGVHQQYNQVIGDIIEKLNKAFKNNIQKKSN